MATVLERFNHLGLASSNPVLMKAGLIVSDSWNRWYNYKPNVIIQKEGDREFVVNDYPEFWTHEIDKIILSFVENGMQNGKAD